MNIFDVRENLDTIVLDHEQQIKDLAAQLLELKQSTAMFKPGMSVTQGDVTPMMEFKRREWVGLTDEEITRLYKEHAKYQEEGMKLSGWGKFATDVQSKLREKNT